jgi:hypothetical protein
MIVTATTRRLGEIGFQPGQCPALDSSFQTCLLNGNQVPCSFIRECDPYTGAVHFEYALPYGSQNVNIWDIAGNQAYWLGPNPKPDTQPVFPDYVTQATTFGNTQLLTASSVPVVTHSQVTQPAPTSGTQTTTPTNTATTPAIQTGSNIGPATPPTGNGLTEVATRVWKQITAGDAAANQTSSTATVPPAPWYRQIPWWVWVIVAAGGAYTLGRNRK